MESSIKFHHTPKIVIKENISSLNYYTSQNNRCIGVNMHEASELLLGVSLEAELTRLKLIDVACSAMDELSKLVEAGEPLWKPHEEDIDETLNDIEYLRQFREVDVGEPQNLPIFDSSQSQDQMSKENMEEDLLIEASRDTAADIKMDPINIVELLMDVDQWSRAFYDIVARAKILTTFSDGVQGSYDRKLHVMSAEYHLPSPILPTRECDFARYCKQLSEDTWGVVDVSLEKFFSSSSNKYRKRPSGCLITGIPGGSKVTWVEHVEADHSQISNLFKPLVTSNLAFGATRWLASLVRHVEWFESLKATKYIAEEVGGVCRTKLIDDDIKNRTVLKYWKDQVNVPQIGRTRVLKVANRLMRSFCANVSGTTCNQWVQLYKHPSSIDVRVMVERIMNAKTKKPRGTLMVFTTTLFINVSPNRLFNFLRDGESRKEWDARKRSFREFGYMITGERQENRVSLLRPSSDDTEIFYMQESYTDSSVAYVVYAPLDKKALTGLCGGRDVIAFPSGFAIIPGGLPRNGEENNGGNDAGTGSILTIAFHHTAKDKNIKIHSGSIEAIYNNISATTTNIKDAMEFRAQLNR